MTAFDEFWSNKFIFTVLKESFYYTASDVFWNLTSSCGEGIQRVLFLNVEICRCCMWILPWNVVFSPSIPTLSLIQ